MTALIDNQEQLKANALVGRQAPFRETCGNNNLNNTNMKSLKDLGVKALIGFLLFIGGIILIGAVSNGQLFASNADSSPEQKAAVILNQISPLKLEVDTANNLIKADMIKINELKAQYNSLMGL